MTSARLTTTAVAIAVLTITAACSRATSEPSADGTGASSASSTTSKPLTDFIENEYYSFATPGGQIQCRVRDESLACQFEGDGNSLTVADSALCSSGTDRNRARPSSRARGSTRRTRWTTGSR